MNRPQDYTFEVSREPENLGGDCWRYRIHDPGGHVHLSGHRTGTRKEVEAHLEACIDRLNMPLKGAHWKETSIMQYGLAK